MHLHVNAGDELQIIVGQAHVEQPLWIAECMTLQRSLLTASQLYRFEHSGWVSLTSNCALEFTHQAAMRRPSAFHHAMQRISQLRAWLAYLIHTKIHDAR